MNKLIFCLLICLLPCTFLSAQSYAFGVKGGLTVGFQKWDGFEQDPLFRYHGIAFIETAPEENAFAVFAQLGYHLKGSAFRNRNFVSVNGNISRPSAREFIFRNLSLTAGAKQKFDFGSGGSKAYYLIGFRGDFTTSTNLSEYEDANRVYNNIYPFEGQVRKWNYGVTVGGGLEFPFSEYISGLLEFTVNPDFSLQYEQLSGGLLVTQPWTGNQVALRDRRITNNTFELSLGLRFLVVVEYIDPTIMW